MNAAELWAFLPWGYALTVAIETPILLVGLCARHRLKDRLIAGFALTACTYPIVVLSLPLLIRERGAYLVVAETFAPLAECLLFWLAFNARTKPDKRATRRDMLAIVIANLASFLVGELLAAQGINLL